MAQDRWQVLEIIAGEVAACQACPLHRGRKKTVPGDGPVTADLMFIGEAPGQAEDEQGLPFVGRSGQYLEQLLGMIGLKRGEVFIANVVKCRPPDNRDPLPEELTACKPFLDRQIGIIQPKVIATLGRFSMARYFPDGKITKIHGMPKVEGGIVYFPLFHPAAILRNPDLRPAMEEDFRRLKHFLDRAKTGEFITEGGETSSPDTSDEAPPPVISRAPAAPPPTPPKQLGMF
jgi:DNA polymerase